MDNVGISIATASEPEQPHFRTQSHRSEVRSGKRIVEGIIAAERMQMISQRICMKTLVSALGALTAARCVILGARSGPYSPIFRTTALLETLSDAILRVCHLIGSCPLCERSELFRATHGHILYLGSWIVLMSV